MRDYKRLKLKWKTVPGAVRVREQALFGEVFGQVSYKLSVALARLIRLGTLGHSQEVCGERLQLCLLHLKPVHRHLEQQTKE